MIGPGIATVVLGSVALLAAERTHARWRAPAKLVASTGFVLVAVGGGIEGSYATWILVGLGLSWIGDAALLGTSDRSFLTGLIAFLLGHVAYVVAFAGLPPVPSTAAIALGVLWLGTAVVVARWLLPRTTPRMRRPVGAYMVVISAMVVLSGGAAVATGDVRIPLGAVAFAVSDIAVARDRFVAPGFTNRLWGLPLYYLSQVLLALTVG